MTTTREIQDLGTGVCDNCHQPVDADTARKYAEQDLKWALCVTCEQVCE